MAENNKIVEVRFARQFAGMKVRYSYHWRHEETTYNRDRVIEGIITCGPIIPGQDFCWLFIDGVHASPLSTNSEAIYAKVPSQALWTDELGVSNGDYEVVAIDEEGNIMNIALEADMSVAKTFHEMEAFTKFEHTASKFEKTKNGVIYYYSKLSTEDFELLKTIVAKFSRVRCSLWSVKGKIEV